MAVEVKTSTALELAEEDDYDGFEYPDTFYLCAYCNEDQGRDHMKQMCADCFWEYDSLCKRPGRIQWSLIDPKYADRLDEVERWVQEAVEVRNEFREKLKAGQERIWRELEAAEAVEVEPPALEDMTIDEIQDRLLVLDQQRKAMRLEAQDRDFTPEEKTVYEQLDKEILSLTDEYTRRAH